MHARGCPGCGKICRAEIPIEHRSAFGPRLVATIAALTGVLKASRRDAQEFIEDGLGIPISVGSVSELESEVAESLDEAYLEAANAVREAPHRNVDETGWKQAGQRCWLWVAAAPLVAFFLIHPSRGKAAFADLLGKVRGMITSDRWHVYASVTNRRRQICWAHLKRDFRRLAERQGEARKIGEAALDVTGQVFLIWGDFRSGGIDRATLQGALKGLKVELHSVLERGVALGLPKVSRFCANLLALEPALWNFTKHEGIEPTNNHAERVIRGAVIWRKRSFGSVSERGHRYVERMLTVAQSCRLQKRRIHSFLVEAIRAKRAGELPPSILPQPV
jgi:transposase